MSALIIGSNRMSLETSNWGTLRVVVSADQLRHEATLLFAAKSS